MKKEELEIESLGSENVDDVENKKEKKGISFHLIFIIGVVLIIGIVFWRLISWSHRSMDIEEIDPKEFNSENLDYFVYPDTTSLENHTTTGKGKLLVIGNGYVSNYGKKHSILNIMKDNLDSEITPLLMDAAIVSSLSEEGLEPTDATDAFSLYRVARALCLGETEYMDKTDGKSSMYSSGDKAFKEYMETLHEIDLNEYDTIVIMYDLCDYYAVRPLMIMDAYDIRGYYGAWDKSVKLFQETFPHLNIVISSPTPEYLISDDEEMQLSTIADYGYGNASIYNNNSYTVALDNCVSYIDNFYYVINEDNIMEYVDGFWLTDKGIDAIGEHVVSFLKKFEK